MAREVETQLGEPIAYERSWVIGDKLSDLGFGRALGTHVALIKGRYWNESRFHAPAILIADSLSQAAQAILSHNRD